jgi:hypothetical protein
MIDTQQRSLLVIQKLWSLSMFQSIFLPHQHGRSALDTSRTLFLLASTQGVSCRLVMNHLIYMYMFSLTPLIYMWISVCTFMCNMERDQSFWITSSEHQGTMPKRIFSFSCSMQVIQFADLLFHLIKYLLIKDTDKDIWVLLGPHYLRSIWVYICHYIWNI